MAPVFYGSFAWLAPIFIFVIGFIVTLTVEESQYFMIGIF